MDFWNPDIQDAVRGWDKTRPLLLIGPTGIGKTTCASKLFENRQIIWYHSSSFRDTKRFLEDLKNTLYHKSILEAFSVSTPKAVIVENIDSLTSTEKQIIKFLSGIHSPTTPIILTARKPEKRHREILRGSYVVKILNVNKDCGYFNKSQKEVIKKGETNLRVILSKKHQIVHESEDISILSSQILNGDITSVPDTVSLTEKCILVNTLIENLGDRFPEKIRVIADRSFSKIFNEERWDLVRVIDHCVIPTIIEEIKINGPVKDAKFSIMLSRISTRALNRKTLISSRNGIINNPILYLHENIESLPSRFRVKKLFKV